MTVDASGEPVALEITLQLQEIAGNPEQHRLPGSRLAELHHATVVHERVASILVQKHETLKELGESGFKVCSHEASVGEVLHGCDTAGLHSTGLQGLSLPLHPRETGRREAVVAGPRLRQSAASWHHWRPR